MFAYVKTDIGRVRQTNEDSYLFRPPELFAVADGMGGHIAGEIASSMAVEVFEKYYNENLHVAKPENLLTEAIAAANDAVYEKSCNNAEYAGMGTTFTAVMICEQAVYWAHVGDSRLYLLHDGNQVQLTQDHALAWEMAKSGLITPAEALAHPKRNMLTRAVGVDETIKVDTGICYLHSGDKLLICTDGLTNMVGEDYLETALKQEGAAGDAILEHLIGQANLSGGNDNITAILVIA